MLLQPHLEGYFVRLEPLSLDHAPRLAEAASGPRDTYSLTSVPDGDIEAVAWIAAALAERDAGKAVPFATIDLQTGTVAGSTRFFDLQYWRWAEGNPNQRGASLPGALEIGYTWLAPWAQRTGINTEAKLLMLEYAFNVLRVHRVRIATDSRNERSRAAIERLGAQLDGVLRAASSAYDGAVRDTASYSILDSEWPAIRERLSTLLQARQA